VASSKKDFLQFPADAIDGFGYELYLVQTGQHPPSAKPLKGLGSGVLELSREFEGGAFRAVYTVRFRDVVYVLHAFRKKSKRGIATPATDLALIRRRLADAVRDHADLTTKEKRS
jgi:phage-related protein